MHHPAPRSRPLPDVLGGEDGSIQFKDARLCCFVMRHPLSATERCRYRRSASARLIAATSVESPTRPPPAVGYSAPASGARRAADRPARRRSDDGRPRARDRPFGRPGHRRRSPRATTPLNPIGIERHPLPRSSHAPWPRFSEMADFALASKPLPDACDDPTRQTLSSCAKCVPTVRRATPAHAVPTRTGPQHGIARARSSARALEPHRFSVPHTTTGRSRGAPMPGPSARRHG